MPLSRTLRSPFRSRVIANGNTDILYFSEDFEAERTSFVADTRIFHSTGWLPQQIEDILGLTNICRRFANYSPRLLISER
ncbi:hypothetical protein F3U23_24875 [Salmonella enterica]|nr:hypothetical protein [Salmonella enterica]